MGERLLCKQEVIGSIPFTSTKPNNIFNCCLIKLTKPSHREFLSSQKRKIYFCTYDNSSDKSAISGCLGIKRR